MYSASRICERSPPLFLRRIVVSRLRRIRLRRKYLIPKPVLSLHAASLHNSSKLITRSRELRSMSRERIISYVMQTSWLAWMSCPTCARRRLAFFKRGARGMPGGGSVTACDPAASAPLPLLRRGRAFALAAGRGADRTFPTCARRRRRRLSNACDPVAAAPLPLLRRGVLSLWLPVAALIVNAACQAAAQ